MMSKETYEFLRMNYFVGTPECPKKCEGCEAEAQAIYQYVGDDVAQEIYDKIKSIISESKEMSRDFDVQKLINFIKNNFNVNSSLTKSLLKEEEKIKHEAQDKGED
jgi:hypothetical protein